jgi:hypothetical protein
MHGRQLEAFVWLTDIARVSREEAAAIMRSNASGVLRCALASISVTDGADAL